MSDLDYAQFDALFDQFADSPTSTTVFRWEALQQYSVARDDPYVTAFRDGTPRPERSVRTSPWLARIARSVILDNKVWQRVRYAEEPWNLYTAHQMIGYQESLAVGDQPFVTTRHLARPRRDFWLFSGTEKVDRYAIDMHYDSDGVPTRFEYIAASDVLAGLHAAASEALAGAVPLNEYLARHVVAGAH